MNRRVTLVDTVGSAAGEMDVVEAHTAPGYVHIACSAVLFGPDDTVLLQRRADHKATFGGYWSNTCCTHPYSDEVPHQAAQRRLHEELGIAVELRPVGTFRYRAEDPVTGMVEHELDHVSIATLGTTDLAFHLDRNEVAEVAFVPIADVATDVATLNLTPWFDMVLRIARCGKNA